MILVKLGTEVQDDICVLREIKTRSEARQHGILRNSFWPFSTDGKLIFRSFPWGSDPRVSKSINTLKSANKPSWIKFGTVG